MDAVRALIPEKADTYYLAFDIVYDNMDVVNKLIELRKLSEKYPGQIILLDMICFEHIIFSFSKLIQWTGNGHKDVIEIRKHILGSIKDHRINLDRITDEKTRQYLMSFKHYSTERVLKSITYMLTDKDQWNIKGSHLGGCWHLDCCVLDHEDKKQCQLDSMTGNSKIIELLSDQTTQKIVTPIQ